MILVNSLMFYVIIKYIKGEYKINSMWKTLGLASDEIKTGPKAPLRCMLVSLRFDVQ